ncbi:2-aminoadipate transaminase [Micromonospora sp. MW-13]|uniref:aminotransferase-like domain-containing protein n=1 Tax=unclassified Micromonospora TaxID=2617518 RepID=UPI000E43DB33|nr:MULTISPECIES: PLP-dependent aminotransferase family protein [unclassified Micromonospora]MCX4471461.1 PLP-dependent aminotransferase family protein [Micromonospora sp. NBC_01655]RGC64973.1 2-aminoadipate transaminase [Micromonospora sp. MW-13]
MSNGNRASEIAARLRERIETSSAGAKLPGVRELSKEFQASAATVSAALSELTALGLVRAEPGRGTFVANRGQLSEPDYSWQSQALDRARVDANRASRLGGYGTPDHIPLSWGYLAPELVPSEELHRIGSRAAKSSRAWMMTPPAGSPELRRILAAEYRADPNDVLVVSGGQQGLVFAMRTLAEPGATVITESPSYPGAILAAQSAGLELASVPADANGIMVDRLADELERTKARVIYIQPSYANPTGAVLSAERRTQVIELATRYGAFIIEDDWARHLGFEGQTPAPLFTEDPHGHVVSIFTLSKPASPGLRLGAVIARGPAGERLRASRTADDLCVAPIVQEIAHGLLTSNVWPRHLKRLRAELTTRRDALVSMIQSAMPSIRIPSVPQGGIHLWVRLPQGTSTQELSATAYQAGVLIGDGRHFFVDEPPAPFLRFSYGAATEAQMAEGIRRLSEAATD